MHHECFLIYTALHSHFKLSAYPKHLQQYKTCDLDLPCMTPEQKEQFWGSRQISRVLEARPL